MENIFFQTLEVAFIKNENFETRLTNALFKNDSPYGIVHWWWWWLENDNDISDLALFMGSPMVSAILAAISCHSSKIISSRYNSQARIFLSQMTKIIHRYHKFLLGWKERSSMALVVLLDCWDQFHLCQPFHSLRLINGLYKYKHTVFRFLPAKKKYCSFVMGAYQSWKFLLF